MRRGRLAALAALLPAPVAAAIGGGSWISYDEQTAERLSANEAVGALDEQEKDYAWGDVDGDGDTDLVVVRKQPFTTAGGRRNVLLLNEDGVLTDRTADFIGGFLDETNDRDVQLVDVDGDGRLDVVTAAMCQFCDSATIVDDSRLYLNLGEGGGAWLGFGAPRVLLEGNFNAVAAGDVTGDGFADLYFVSFNSTDHEDTLLVNGGAADPGAFADESFRLTTAMLTSAYGTNAVIVDVNGDGFNDIAKSENGPVEIYYNEGSGTFSVLDPVHFEAHYYVAAGDLNGDGLLDLVLEDDGVDDYLLHQGNGGDAIADFTAYQFPESTAGFGSNSVIADLDGDGFNDVITADVDVDAPGCQRVTDILRNLGDPPDVTFAFDPGNLPEPAITGVFDVAVFDLDGDALLDLVLGRCDGTAIWVGRPSLRFAYPDGLPDVVTPGEPTAFAVELTATSEAVTVENPTQHVSIGGGPFAASALVPVAGDLYEATLPAASCGDSVAFYFSAELSDRSAFTDPPAAPAGTYHAVSAAGFTTVFSDTIEGDVSGWSVENDPSLSSGAWERADPNPTLHGAAQAAPGADATPDGTLAFVTENGPVGGEASATDVDGGPTRLVSPVFDLAGTDGLVRYARWAYTDFATPDSLTVEISNDDGATWVLVDAVENTGSAWEVAGFVVGEYVEPTSQLRLRFSACDCPNDSVTEAGIDDVEVLEMLCCPWDLDGSGDVGTEDFLALLATWGTDPGDPPDFDGDGTVGTSDFLALLANWGPC